MIGNMMPAIPDEDEMIPYANPRRLLNQLGMTLKTGCAMAQSPIGLQMPCASRTS